MVWFQCEDCGDNLKKPKLPNHFRQCSAYKLSCIDCGQVFGQQDVEGHTQCITEAEKYGPKGQTKSANGTNTKPKNDGKQRPEVDINVGLSDRPPWFCSLCNTKATSKQTLLLHADGKKHRAKARAFHASKQPPNNGAAETNGSNENKTTNEIPENKVAPQLEGPEVKNDALASNKKRKADASENDGAHPKTGGEISAEIGNGEVVQIKGSETEVKKVKKAKQGEPEKDAEMDSTADINIGKKKIKWKKLITSALESNQDGAVKFKKLKKEVMKSLKEAGHHTEEKNQVSEILEHNINSSSRFVVDGKYVRLAKCP